MVELLISALIGYLLGSFPTGYVLVKAIRGIDIRNYGSGKTGGTNVARVLGYKALLPVAIGDLGKSLLAVLLVRWLFNDPTLDAIAGLFAVAGHNWPVYIGFRGGSGIGPSAAVMLLFSPPIAAILFLLFVLIVIGSRYVSLASVTATIIGIALLIWTAIEGRTPPPYLIFGIPAAILILIRHRGNIQRLLTGTERRIGEKH